MAPQALAGPFQGSARFIMQDASGLMVSLPRVDRSHIAALLKAQRERLQAQLDCLTRSQQSHRFGVGDAVITVILPGGLIYAAYRAHQIAEISSRLASVKDRLDAIAMEMPAFDRPRRPQQIAALPDGAVAEPAPL